MTPKLAHPQIIPTVPRPNHDERRASALADIQQMVEDLQSAAQDNGQLRADLAREQDRCAMLIEERDRYRAEALVFRSKLIELATVQANVGLLMVKAQEVVATIHEITTAPARTADVLDRLDTDIGESQS